MRQSIALALALLFPACGSSGGQSGTDQFDVGRVTPTTNEDAGSSPAEEPEPSSTPGPSEPEPSPSEPEPVPLPATENLCDGSDDIRFSSIHSGVGGPVAYYNAFLSENFVVVDGACRYWLNSPDIGGLRSGVLSTEEAAILSQTLHYGQYEPLSNYESVQCPDGGAWTLVDDTHDLVCRCGICGSGSEPEEFREAFAAAAQLELDLSQKGEWAWGPTRVLPIVSSDNSFYLPWTLEVALADVAFDTAEQSSAPDEGVLIDDPEQLALLWELRQQNIDRGAGMQMFVRDDEGNGFALFVRDQPPRAVMDALSVDIHD